MTRSQRQVTLRVNCPTSAVVDVGPGDVHFTMANEIVDDVQTTCPRCGVQWSVSDDVGVVALLHGFGVRTVRDDPSHRRALVGDDRAVVSLRLLLDDPSFATRLAQTQRIPPDPVDDEDSDSVH